MTGADLEWWVTSYVINIKRNSIYHIYGLVLPCLCKKKFFNFKALKLFNN